MSPGYIHFLGERWKEENRWTICTYYSYLPGAAQCSYTCGQAVLEQSFALFVWASTGQGSWWQGNWLNFLNWLLTVIGTGCVVFERVQFSLWGYQVHTVTYIKWHISLISFKIEIKLISESIWHSYFQIVFNIWIHNTGWFSISQVLFQS